MGILKQLFSKKTPTFSLQSLEVDLHSHFVPGIDDGAKTLEDSIGMLWKMTELGYKKCIITPHVKKDVFDNTSETILTAYKKLTEEVTRINLPIELAISAEYFLDEHLFEKVNNNDVLLINQQYLLFELAFRTPPNQLNEFIFLCQSKGIKPIIAHFERYEYFHGSLNEAKDLKNRSVLIQVNLNSFSGHYGPAIKKQALQLLDEDLIDILGTDGHRIEHLQLLEKQIETKLFQKILSKNYLNNQFL